MNELYSESHCDYGEAWMYCSDCGGKLFSFDGYDNSSKKCPYRNIKNGRCEPLRKING